MEGLIVFLVLILLIFTSVPVAFAMIAVSMGVYFFVADIPIGVVAQNLYYNIRSYSFSAVPYFILAGTVMARGTLAQKLLDIAESFVGWVPCGMAMSMVIGCAMFGSITGSDLATLAAIGGIMYPALVARGWPKVFVAGILGPSALLGMLVPPSIPDIIYALVAEVSVMKLFLAGVMPAVIIVVLFISYIFLVSRKYFPDRSFQRPDFKGMATSVKNGLTALGMPVIIFGGIYGGVFTVTESAAAAAGYAIIIELLVHRGIKIKELPALAIETGLTTAVILFLVSGAMVLARYLTLQEIPQTWANYVFQFVHNKWVFMGIVNFFLLVTGCLMDVTSATVILVPVLQEMYTKYGINDIYFGQIFLLNFFIGYLTPPVGINIFVVSSMFNIPFITLCRAYVPYFLILIAVLIMMILFPPITLWLPDIFVGR